MKRLLDINTWIALTVEKHPYHAAARRWYEQATLAVGELVFCLPTELGFLRLITQKAVMAQCGSEPLTNEEAVAFLANVYRDTAVSRAEEPPLTRDLWLRLALRKSASTHTWMDAYLAAFALTLGSEMVTFDGGFVTYQQFGLNLNLLVP